MDSLTRELRPECVSSLPKRAELPIGAFSSLSAGSRAAGNVLENPMVNPVTGRGRTAADVAYEREIVKARLRCLDTQAVFQADYL